MEYLVIKTTSVTDRIGKVVEIKAGQKIDSDDFLSELINVLLDEGVIEGIPVLTPAAFNAVYQFMINNIANKIHQIKKETDWENTQYNAFDYSAMLAAATGKLKEDIIADIIKASQK